MAIKFQEREQHLCFHTLRLIHIRFGIQVIAVAHTCNPSYSGGRDEDCGWRPAPEHLEDPHLNQ
jgi:hypothetical protein